MVFHVQTSTSVPVHRVRIVARAMTGLTPTRARVEVATLGPTVRVRISLLFIIVIIIIIKIFILCRERRVKSPGVNAT